MSRNEPSWRDRYPDEVTCIRCLEVKDVMELDRLLWCERCRRRARDRAGWWGWLFGLILAACVAVYIWLVIRPTDLVIGGWIATVLATAWLGSKLGREVAYGVMRFKNSKAVDAVPPPPGEAPGED
ncbi:MAG: hypothetical protein LJF04_07335 [Gemmatimonadetes bacterium]|nr:hypothetical protein [Gemmatimonadota bacterium]